MHINDSIFFSICFLVSFFTPLPFSQAIFIHSLRVKVMLADLTLISQYVLFCYFSCHL